MENVDKAVFTGSKYKAHAEFWQQFTAGYEEGYEFRQQNYYSPGNGSLPEKYAFELPADVASLVLQAARGEDTGVFVCLLSAFGILLKKYSGREKMIIDSPAVAGSAPHGPAVKRVPLLLSIADGQTLRETLVGLQQSVKQHYQYQAYPVELLDGRPGATVYPTNVAIRYNRIHGPLASPLPYELALEVVRSGDSLRCTVCYNRTFFSDDLIVRLPGHLSSVLSCLRLPATPVTAIRILTEAERREIVDGFNQTSRPFPAGCTIQELFAERVARHPGAVAVLCEERGVTYQEIDALSNQLAHCLREEYAVVPNTLVGIMADQSELMVIAILGVLKAGGAYVPIDPRYPAERVQYMIEDTALKMVLTQTNYLHQLGAFDLEVFALDVQLDGLDTPAEAVSNRNQASDLAYVIYTSGSTGKPKGVQIEHRNVANLAHWQGSCFGIDHTSRVLQIFSYSFDGAVGETFMALLNGATLCMLNADRLAPHQLAEYLVENRVTLGVFVPSLLKQIEPDLIEKLRGMTVVSVGEACPPELARKWMPHCTFVNAYGPTEYTVYSHLAVVDEALLARSGTTVPIGKPIFNTHTYVLDAGLQPVPVGVKGEIFLSGAGMGRGYLNNRAATLQKFIPNPFFLTSRYRDRSATPLAAGAGEVADFLASLPAPYAGPAHPAPAGLLTLGDLSRFAAHLDADLIEKTGTYLAGFAPGACKYETFCRYFFEGFNNSYASRGIQEAVLKELLPFDDFGGLQGVDFGFGNGEIMMALTRLGAQVTGFELSPFAVQRARERNLSAQMAEVDIRHADFMRQNNLSPASKDFSISTLLLDRVENPRNLIENLLMVLKPGGRFAIQTLLPIQPVDDGDVAVQISYTPEHYRITPGTSVEQDKLYLVQLLYELGAGEIVIDQLPFVVASRDGVQQYDVFSFRGTRQPHGEPAEADHSKLYRTGDVGRYLPGGDLEFIARTDDQVKVRGFRIELGEIEQRLLQYASVREAVVMAAPQDEGDKALVAYLVAGEPLAAADLRAYLKSRLPEYMIPARFVQLAAFPVTRSGKTDRNALLHVAQPAEAAEYCGPETPVEEKLAQIWEEVLGKKRIGIHENFFELGGHSLKATRVVYRIYKELNAIIEITTLFESPSIAALAARIGASASAAFAPIVPVAEQPHYDLSHAQKRLWMLDQSLNGESAYNVPKFYRITGNLDRAGLERALTELVNRHEILRTTFISVEGVPRQQVHPCRDLVPALEYVDLRGEENPEARAREMSQAAMHTVFDLEKGPLLKPQLLHTGPGTYVLFLVMHHIISDRWSMEILMYELQVLYGVHAEGIAHALAPLKIQYKDFTAWQNGQLAHRQEHQEYWTGQLGGELPVLALPADYPRPATKTYNGNTIRFTLDERLTEGLHELKLRYGASLFMVLTASVKALLYQYTRQEDIVIGTNVAGRDHPDLESQVGFYINTLALRTRFSGEDSFAALLGAVKETVMGAYNHQSYPFDLLLDGLDVRRDTSRFPLFDVVVEVQGMDVLGLQRQELRSITLEGIKTELTTSKYDWLFNLVEQGGVIAGSLEYNTDIYAGERMHQVVDRFRRLVTSIVVNPGCPVQDLLAYDPEEREIIKLWSRILNMPLTAVNSDKNFFLAGGDEAKASQLCQSINSVFNVNLSAADLKQHATPASLKSYLSSLNGNLAMPKPGPEGGRKAREVKIHTVLDK